MENRDKLIQTALELFSNRGYDAVGIQEIVLGAGVTKPTLYHYFGNKEGLLQAVLEAHAQPLAIIIEKAAQYTGDLPQTLKQMTQAYFQFALKNKVFFRLLLALHFSPVQSRQYQLAEQVHTRQFKILENVFLKATSDHGNMRGRHQAYAASFLGMVHTYIGMALGGYVKLDETLQTQMVHQFQHGIYS